MASDDIASGSVKFSGAWRTELKELAKGMDRVAKKEAMRPLAKKLAAAALELGIQNASKRAPAASMYARSTQTSFRIGTTKPGAAAHQFGATIYPRKARDQSEEGRRDAMKAARMALAALGHAGGKTFEARQFVRSAGRAGKGTALATAMESLKHSVFGYLTFRVNGRWVRVHRVKLPKRPIFPLDGVPKKWEETFESIAAETIYLMLNPHLRSILVGDLLRGRKRG